MGKKIKIDFCYAALFLLIGFHAFSNCRYLSISNNPPVMEEYNFLEKTINYYEIFKSPDANILVRMIACEPVAGSQAVFCPVYPVMGAVLLLFTGIKDPQFWLCLLHNLFLAILILSVYGIGKRLYSPLAGLAAAVVASTAYFLLVSLTRFILVDVPAAAIFTLTFYLLLRSEGFGSRRFSSLFGLAWGVLILTRASLFIFFPVVVFLIFFQLFMEKAFDRIGTRMAGMSLAMLGFIIPLLYLIPFRQIFISSMLSPSVLTTRASLGPQAKFSLASAVYYLKYGLYDYETIIWVIPLVIGLLFAIIRPRKENALPLVWFIGGYFMLTFVAGVKEPRYFAPLLPAVALLSVSWIEQFRQARIKSALALILVSLSLFSYFAANWGKGPLARDHTYFKLGGFKFLVTPYVRPPHKKIFSIDKVVDIINADAEKRDVFHAVSLYINNNINRGNFDSRLRIPKGSQDRGVVNVLTLFLDLNINGKFTYKTKFTDLSNNYPWVINIPSSYYYDKNNDDSRNKFWLPVEFFLEADYIILRSGDFLQRGLVNPKEDKYIEDANILFNQPLLDFHSNFKLLAKVNVPYDGSYFLIYKRVSAATVKEALSLTGQAIKMDPGNIVKHLNTLQSFLIKNLKAKYALPPELLLYLDEPYNGSLDIYVWPERRLKRLLAGLPPGIPEKRLLLDMEKQIRGFSEAMAISLEKLEEGNLIGKAYIEKKGRYYLVKAEEGLPDAIVVDNTVFTTGSRKVVANRKFTSLLEIELAEGEHTIKIPLPCMDNLVKEGSFEKQLQAWKIMTSDQGLPGRIDVDWSLVSDGSDGMSCLNLVARKQVIGAYQEIDISKMDKDNCYILTLDYRHISGLAPEMIVWEYPYEYPVNPLVTLDNADGQWQNYLTLIRPKEKTKKLIIYFYSRSDGKAVSENLFDNVRLYMAPSGSVVERLWVIKK